MWYSGCLAVSTSENSFNPSSRTIGQCYRVFLHSEENWTAPTEPQKGRKKVRERNDFKLRFEFSFPFIDSQLTQASSSGCWVCDRSLTVNYLRSYATQIKSSWQHIHKGVLCILKYIPVVCLWSRNRLCQSYSETVIGKKTRYNVVTQLAHVIYLFIYLVS